MSKKIISLGCINITLSLTLSKNDIEELSINWDNLNNLKDLSFIKTESNLWNKIEIKSDDISTNFFLYMNKVNKNKIYIQYVTLSEIIYDEEQKEFKEFVQQITGLNFLYIYSKKVFNSTNNIIKFELIYETNKKLFQMTSTNKSVCNTESNNSEEENNFIKLSKNKNIFKYFDFLILDFTKIKEDFSNLITMKNWNIFFNNIKKDFGIKIIFYMDNFSLNTEEKKIFKNIDIFIFPDKNNMQNIINLIKLTEEHNQKLKEYDDTKNVYERNNNNSKIFEKRKEKEDLKFKKNKTFQSKSLNKYSLFQNNISKISTLYNNYNQKRIRTIHRNKSNEMKNISKISNITNSYNYSKPLNMKNTIVYFKEHTSLKKSSMLSENKILIFLDEFNSAIFCILNKKESNPFIYNFEFKLFPVINIHNIEEINIYKNIIKNNFKVYSIIFFSCVLRILTEEKKDNEDSCIKAFIFGNKCLKNVIEYEKTNGIFPQNKNIFLTKINKEDITNFKIKPKSERRFILDGNDVTKKKILYNPLLDKFSTTYFSSKVSRNIIRQNGLIDDKGNIFYDQMYKDSLGANPKYTNNKYITDKELNKDIYSMNILKNIKNKETDNINRLIKNKYILDKKIIGYNQKAYQYSIYSNAIRKRMLPRLYSKNKLINVSDRNRTTKTFSVKIKINPVKTEI